MVKTGEQLQQGAILLLPNMVITKKGRNVPDIGRIRLRFRFLHIGSELISNSGVKKTI